MVAFENSAHLKFRQQASFDQSFGNRFDTFVLLMAERLTKFREFLLRKQSTLNGELHKISDRNRHAVSIKDPVIDAVQLLSALRQLVPYGSLCRHKSPIA